MPASLRRAVFVRDRGVCRACRLDTAAVQAEADELLAGLRCRLVDAALADRGTSDRGTSDRGTSDRGTSDRGTSDRGISDRGISDLSAADYFRLRNRIDAGVREAGRYRFDDAVLSLAAKHGLPRFAISHGRSLWQMDHVVPLVEGGHPTDLANVRTLCLACHQAETAGLAARRALARRAGWVPIEC